MPLARRQLRRRIAPPSASPTSSTGVGGNARDWSRPFSKQLQSKPSPFPSVKQPIGEPAKPLSPIRAATAVPEPRTPPRNIPASWAPKVFPRPRPAVGTKEYWDVLREQRQRYERMNPVTVQLEYERLIKKAHEPWQPKIVLPTPWQREPVKPSPSPEPILVSEPINPSPSPEPVHDLQPDEEPEVCLPPQVYYDEPPQYRDRFVALSPNLSTVPEQTEQSQMTTVVSSRDTDESGMQTPSPCAGLSVNLTAFSESPVTSHQHDTPEHASPAPRDPTAFSQSPVEESQSDDVDYSWSSGSATSESTDGTSSSAEREMLIQRGPPPRNADGELTGVTQYCQEFNRESQERKAARKADRKADLKQRRRASRKASRAEFDQALRDDERRIAERDRGPQAFQPADDSETSLQENLPKVTPLKPEADMFDDVIPGVQRRLAESGPPPIQRPTSPHPIFDIDFGDVCLREERREVLHFPAGSPAMIEIEKVESKEPQEPTRTGEQQQCNGFFCKFSRKAITMAKNAWSTIRNFVWG